MIFKHEKIDLGYDDLTCVTRPEGRKYTTPPGTERREYPSITTVLGSVNKASIEAWKLRVGEEVWKKVLFRASQRGTAVHETVERYLNNDENFSLGCMPHIIETFNDMKSIFDERIGTIYGQELPLYSNHLGVAGRVDCIADFDGELSIIDFKTSAKPKKEEWIHNYYMQECFYSAALFERTGMKAHQLVTIMAVDNFPTQVFIERMDDWIEPLQEIIKNYNE